MDISLHKDIQDIVTELSTLTLEKLNKLHQEHPTMEKKRLQVSPFNLRYAESTMLDVALWKTRISGPPPALEQNQVLHQVGKKPRTLTSGRSPAPCSASNQTW
jgi:hypothetical protein